MTNVEDLNFVASDRIIDVVVVMGAAQHAHILEISRLPISGKSARATMELLIAPVVRDAACGLRFER
jgi:hypothetical protein